MITAKHIILSHRDRSKLEEIHKRGQNTRVARRAHAILLSSQGFTAVKVAELINTTNATVYRWDDSGLAGLHDKPRPGRPPIWNTEEDQQVVSDVIKAEPRSSSSALAEIIRITGKPASPKTLRRTLKKGG